MLGRAGNSGGTREPSSQKEFDFAESFFDFEIFTELNIIMGWSKLWKGGGMRDLLSRS